MRNACTRNTAESNSTKESSQSITRDSFAIKSNPFMSTEYKTIVAACPRIPARSAPTTFFLSSLPAFPSSYSSSYRSYPCLLLSDGGGKDCLFIILHHIQIPGTRSGRYQISNFFEHFRCSSGAAQMSKKNRFFYSFCVDSRPVLNLNIFNNLMNSLPAQVKFICNLAERRTGCSHLQNFVISVRICGRTRLQRTPLPAANSLDSRSALVRKLIFSPSLANVPDPSTQSNFIIINNFDVNSRHITIALSARELRKSFNVGIKSGDVVHKTKISTTPAASRKQLTYNYLLQQNLTLSCLVSKLDNNQGDNV